MVVPDELEDVGTFCERVPVHFEVGALGFGVGVGCGVGVGVGKRVPIQSLPGGSTVSSGVQTGLSGFLPLVHGWSRFVRSVLAKTGVQGLDMGLGCGVGIGYGFGVGMVLDPGAFDGWMHSSKRWTQRMHRKMQNRLGGKGASHEDEGRSAHNAHGTSTSHSGVDASSSPGRSANATTTKKELATDSDRKELDGRELELMRTVLRQQDKLDTLQEELRELRHAVCENSKKKPAFCH